MPRGDIKAYGSVTVRLPQDLLDQVKHYASQHRLTMSELVRDGLELRLEEGVPGRSSRDQAEPGLSEVLQGLTSGLQTTVRETIREVLHEVRPSSVVLPDETLSPLPLIYTDVTGQHEVFPVPSEFTAPQGEGLTEVIPQSTEGLTEVRHEQAARPQPDTHGMTEVLPLVPTMLEPGAEGHTEVLPTYDTQRFTLGKLCKRGHDWQGTGKTLYRLPGRACPQCDAERTKERRAQKKAATAWRVIDLQPQ